MLLLLAPLLLLIIDSHYSVKIAIWGLKIMSNLIYTQNKSWLSQQNICTLGVGVAVGVSSGVRSGIAIRK